VSVKRLTKVGQRMALHAVSAFSCLHPILGETCAEHKLESIEVDLIYARFQPAIPYPPAELISVAAALREQFQEMLVKEGFNLSVIVSALATFRFEDDGWPIDCQVTIQTFQRGRITVMVDNMSVFKIAASNNGR
jgi:hypothetical protein